MTAVNDTFRTAEFLVSEANGYRSRDQIALATTPALVAGTVLAVVAGDYVPYDGDSTVSGASTAEAILFEGVEAGFDGVVTVVNADAEVNLAHLTYTDGTEAALVADLAALGIKAR